MHPFYSHYHVRCEGDGGEGWIRMDGRSAAFAPNAHDTPSIQITDVDVPDARVRRTRKQLIRLLMSLHLALAY